MFYRAPLVVVGQVFLAMNHGQQTQIKKPLGSSGRYYNLLIEESSTRMSHIISGIDMSLAPI
jgi:hypothetical protein